MNFLNNYSSEDKLVMHIAYNIMKEKNLTLLDVQDDDIILDEIIKETYKRINGLNVN